MVQITKASELAKVAEDGKVKFEKTALESSSYKKLIQFIEDSALEGYTSCRNEINKDEYRTYEVFLKYLQEAGYEVELKSIPITSILINQITGYKYQLYVSWKQK